MFPTFDYTKKMMARFGLQLETVGWAWNFDVKKSKKCPSFQSITSSYEFAAKNIANIELEKWHFNAELNGLVVSHAHAVTCKVTLDPPPLRPLLARSQISVISGVQTADSGNNMMSIDDIKG